MVTVNELLMCAFEQGYGKLSKGSKKYNILLDIVQKEYNKIKNKSLRNEKKRCSKEIICEYCKRKIMYKDDCVSYYNPLTKIKKIYHFNCQFHSI